MIEGVSAIGVYSIEKTVRIGRGDENEILLADRSVSRAHAVVAVDGPEPIVRDLGSTNGTFVNGERVKTRELRNGDELKFGNTHMRFEVRQA
jgi:adenylate cyclase